MVDSLTALIEDPRRLEAVRRSGLLDSPAEQGFDWLTRLAANALQVPVAVLTVVARDRQFFKSDFGLPEPWRSRRELPLSHSFSKYAVATGKPLIFADAAKEPMFRDHPGLCDLGFHGFLSMPLKMTGGETIGTLAVLDRVPRNWTPEQIWLMQELASFVQSEIQRRASFRGCPEADLGPSPDLIPGSGRLRDDFLARLSQELRTPLHAILGFGQLLELDPLTSDQRENVDQILRGGRHVLGLINDVLDVPRSESWAQRVGDPGPVPATLLLIGSDRVTEQHIEVAVAGRADLRLQVASQGRIGLSLARIRRPQVILLDVELADGSVAEVLHGLERDEGTRGIPVILLGSAQVPASSEFGVKPGTHQHIMKPLDAGRLLGDIDRLLGKDR